MEKYVPPQIPEIRPDMCNTRQSVRVLRAIACASTAGRTNYLRDAAGCSAGGLKALCMPEANLPHFCRYVSPGCGKTTARPVRD